MIFFQAESSKLSSQPNQNSPYQSSDRNQTSVKMQVNTISKSKLHCIVVILILFILVFLSLPLFLIRLANDNYNDLSQASANESVAPIDGRPVECKEGFFPCMSSPSSCIPQIKQCDNVDDCKDHSDEERCYDASGAITSIFRDILELRAKYPGGHKLAIPASCDEERFYEDACPCNLTEHNVVICDNAGLQAIPNNLLESVYKLRINNNSIEDLNQVNWPKALSSLALVNNRITSIGEKTFESIRNLSKLYISHNQISHIDPNAFKHLRSLSTLQFESNKLTRFAPELLDDKPMLAFIYLSDNQIDLDPDIRFSRAPNVKRIFLDQNRITAIRQHHFSNMTRLLWLSLANNRIASIEINSFQDDYDLQELNLSFNHIQVVDRRIFAHRLNIQRLFLSANPIETLPVDAFRELLELRSLNLTQIEFKSLERETFSYLKMLKFIYFEKFGYCYYAATVRVCRPLTDGVSTIEEMLAFPILKYAVWIVALVCSLGNIIVLIWRTLSKHEDRTLSLFVKNLSIADLMMGIYLCTIAWQDSQFEHEFRKHADKWMSSWQCTAIGFLAILSSELSVFLLTIITIERYRAIVSIRRFEEETFMRRARLSIALAWLFSFLIASYPLVEWLSQDSSAYYATNGLCLPLHIDQPYGRGWQYSAFVYLGINFAAVILMISLYARMYMIIIDGHQTSRPHLLGGEKRQDAILAIRFFFIVVTDCLCWIPIVVIKLIALRLDVSASIYGWLVVFIIPINSALNPIVYTLANPSSLFCRLLGCLYRKLDATCERIERVWSNAVGRASKLAPGSSGNGDGGLGGCVAAGGSRPAMRPVRPARGSNYSSSRSSTSISAGSEAQLMTNMSNGASRRRTKLGSVSTSTCFEHFDSSVLAQGKCGFESALLTPLVINSNNIDINQTRQGQQMAQTMAGPPLMTTSQHHAGYTGHHLHKAHLLNVHLDLTELTTAGNHQVELSLLGSDQELSQSGPSTGTTGSSGDPESPSLGDNGKRRAEYNVDLITADGPMPRGPQKRSADLLATLNDQLEQRARTGSSSFRDSKHNQA